MEMKCLKIAEWDENGRNQDGRRDENGRDQDVRWDENGMDQVGERDKNGRDQVAVRYMNGRVRNGRSLNGKDWQQLLESQFHHQVL